MCRTNLPVARFIKTAPMFNWANIIKNFENAFKKTFSMDRKAHFDNLPEDLSTVDGAKAHWCILLLLDAMIYILKNEGFNHSTRRAFNQHQVLYDCIFQELKTMDEKSFEVLSTEKKALVNPVEYNKEVTGKYANLSLILMDAAWQSMDALEAQLVSECPASKAKNKFPIIVRLLTQNEAFTQLGNNLHTILQSVTSKALFQFNPDKPILKKSEKVAKAKPSIMDALHEYRNARRENLLLLLSQRLAPSASIDTVPLQQAVPENSRTKLKRRGAPVVAENTQTGVPVDESSWKHVRASSPPRSNSSSACQQNSASLPVASEFDPSDFNMFDGEEFDFDDDLFGGCGAAESKPTVMDVSQQQQQKQEKQGSLIGQGSLSCSMPSSNDFFSDYLTDLAQTDNNNYYNNNIKQEKQDFDAQYQQQCPSPLSSCHSPLNQNQGGGDYTSGESTNGDDNSWKGSSSDSSSGLGSDYECDSIIGDDFEDLDSADLYAWLSPLMNEPPMLSV